MIRDLKGTTPANYWPSNPNGINQVGCVYTAQGFEFDSVGVIWGRDHQSSTRTACS
jgi:DUF2075 family protein